MGVFYGCIDRSVWLMEWGMGLVDGLGNGRSYRIVLFVRSVPFG